MDELPSWRLDEPLPTPSAQIEEIVLWAGDHQADVGAGASLDGRQMAALIGQPLSEPDPLAPLGWLINQAKLRELVEPWWIPGSQVLQFQLTLAGWDLYHSLKTQRVTSRRAFMAMQFGDQVLDKAYQSAFVPAVARAGFELRRVIDGQPAGLIDDQLRVGLRTSRFVVADLTHQNRGAYWEAGFAEGIGRPVIYTCRRKEWESGSSHFDTSHLVTVIWDPEDLEGARNRLAATIRATLPDEAVMEEG